jgi:hypothetical protein
MKLLALAPDPQDGTAYWRVTSPLGALRRVASDFAYEVVRGVSYEQLLGCDALMLQRPFLDEHCVAMRNAALLGRPVWCDWDDDIIDVPHNNVLEPAYRGKRQNVLDLAAAADVVTVSCQALADKIGALRPENARPIVVPNALDPTLRLPPPNESTLPVRRIAWRGGDSHNHDIMALGPAMARVAQETEGETLWHFVGQYPSWLVGDFPRGSVKSHPFRSVPDYLRFMAELRPSILVVPLEDTPFNRHKSNIAVLEAAWLGAAVVAPAWLEGCDLPGVHTYATESAFEAALLAAAKAPEHELRDAAFKTRAGRARALLPSQG